jgi:hypothetical protein
MPIKYKSILELIMHYNQCVEDEDWENFNFPCASEHILNKITDIKACYGQCEEEEYIERALCMNFPGWGGRDLCSYPENKESLTIKNAYENGSRYCFFKLPLHACEELEAIFFHELNEEYKDDPQLSFLNGISDHLCELAFKEDNGFSLIGKIGFIDMALHATHPRGLVFDEYPIIIEEK